MQQLRRLHDVGLVLIPQRAEGAKGKVPIPGRWKPYQEDPPSWRQIERWHRENPDALWAYICGNVSGRLTLDFDGPAGMATLKLLHLRPSVLTPGGGAHVWVHANPQWSVRYTAAGQDFPGMEIKGENTLCTIIGKRPDGTCYRRLKAPIYSLAELPADLRKHMESRFIADGDEAASEHEWTRPSNDWIAAKVSEALTKVDKGEGRNNVGHRLAQKLWWQGCERADVLRFILEFAQAVPHKRDDAYTEDNVKQTVRQVVDVQKRRPPEGVTGRSPTSPFGDDDSASTWTPVDLGAVMRGDIVGPKPSLLMRSDDVPHMYPGRIHVISSEPEAGKSWLALFASEQVMRADECVLYIDFEDSADGVVGRLLAMKVPQEMVEGLFIYVRPDEPFGTAAQTLILSILDERRPHLVVLDGVTEAMSLHGLSIKDNDDSAKFMKLLPRLISRTGAAVLQLDHVTKSTESRGRWAIGAQHKLAGLDGVSFGLEVIQPFGRGLTGSSRLKVFKDRPGYVRPQGGGVFRLASDAEGNVTAEFLPAGSVPEGHHLSEVSDLFGPICDALAETSPLSTKQIKTAVGGKSVRVDFALRELESLGYATFETGPHSARLWVPLRPYTEDDQ